MLRAELSGMCPGIVIADSRAMEGPDHLLLMFPASEEDQPFRLPVRQLDGVLSSMFALGMFWWEFVLHVGEDGIYAPEAQRRADGG